MWEKIKIMGSGIWAFILPFLRQLLKDSGPILIQAAMAAVSAAAGKGTNDDKLKFAINMVRDELTKNGIAIAESMIRAAVEMAVVRSKTTT